ncbi:membrane protein insertion efficiency factor YidD [Candidatus Falkowbacteria bacterium]|nr:membrane protein insertion efficiency factor YidD [Candidatus Falkowbacteria bacterium]
MINYFKHFPRYLIVKILKIYQKTLSFDHGLLKIFKPYGFCRFQPTCSDYAISAIEKYGIIKGGVMASWRLLRCNPWNKGGYDPIENQKF